MFKAAISALVLLAFATTAFAKVETLTAQEFTLLYGRKPFGSETQDTVNGLWMVRFALPSDTTSAAAFTEASERVQPHIARFAEVVLNTPEAFALADLMMIGTFPYIRAVHGRMGRPSITRGQALSGRPVPLHMNMEGADSNPTVDSIVAFTYSSVPTVYPDPWTYSVYATASTVKSMKDLVAESAVRHTMWGQEVAEYEPTKVGKDSEPTFVAILMNTLASPRAAEAVAATYSAGAKLAGRSGSKVFLVSAASRAADFVDWLPTEAEDDDWRHNGSKQQPNDNSPAHIVTYKMKKSGAAIDPSTVKVEKFIADTKVIHDKILSVYGSVADDSTAQRAIQRLPQAQKGPQQFLAPSTKTSYPLRMITTENQFHRDVSELKSGVAVVFFVRSSDKFYDSHIKAARQVAEDSVHNMNAEIGDQAQKLRFEVFAVDVEANKEAARALHVNNVPGVLFFMELQKDGKGFVNYPETTLSSKAIIKFMRGPLFASKNIQKADLSSVPFAGVAATKAVQDKLDLQLASNYFSVDPRRNLPPDAKESKLMTEFAKSIASGETGGDSKSSSKTQSSKKPAKEMTEKEKKAAEKKAAAEEKRKEKIRLEMEKKEKLRLERIKQKEEEDKQREAARVEKAKQKAQEDKEKRAQEAKEGKTKKKDQGSAKGAAKKKKRTLPPKPAKNYEALRKTWLEESVKMSEEFTKEDKHEDGSSDVYILDEIR